MFIESEFLSRSTMELLALERGKEKNFLTSKFTEDTTCGQIQCEKLSPTVDKDIRWNPSLLIWEHLSEKSKRTERN